MFDKSKSYASFDLKILAIFIRFLRSFDLGSFEIENVRLFYKIFLETHNFISQNTNILQLAMIEIQTPLNPMLSVFLISKSFPRLR